MEDAKLTAHAKAELEKHRDSAKADGEDVKELPKPKPATNGINKSRMTDGDLMSWTEILEAMEDVDASIGPNADADPMASTMPGTISPEDEKDLLEKLNQIFTPILVMQSLEPDNKGKIMEALDNASVLTEQNIIKFDDQTRMAQLISTCALLLQQKKNTEKYQAYAKAAAIRNKMKLEMQKEEYDAAKTLAQKYLIMVSSKNNSSVARNAAHNLLPETQI